MEYNMNKTYSLVFLERPGPNSLDLGERVALVRQRSGQVGHDTATSVEEEDMPD